MRIIFLTSFVQPINYFPKLEKKLVSEILDIQTTLEYVPMLLDIPLKATKLIEKCDILFVSFFYQKEDIKIPILLEKLVQLELKTGKTIVKAIDENPLDENPTKDEEKEEIKEQVKKWNEFLKNLILFPEKFELK